MYISLTVMYQHVNLS